MELKYYPRRSLKRRTKKAVRNNRGIKINKTCRKQNGSARCNLISNNNKYE